MTKFVCSCGNHGALSQYPSSAEGWHISAADFDVAVSEAARRLSSDDLESLGAEYPTDASLEERSHDLFADAVTQRARSTVHCPECGALWIQAQPGSNGYIHYRRT